MSELKCPACGSEASDFEQTGIIECEECQFMCDSSDFPRISAAMELAGARAWRKEVWAAGILAISDSLDFADECVKNAEKRVEEVFK